MNEYEQRLAEARKKAAEGAAGAEAENAKESGYEWAAKVAQMSGQGQLAGAAKSKGEYGEIEIRGVTMVCGVKAGTKPLASTSRA